VELVDERRALLTALTACLQAPDLPIVCAYLFGSQVRGEAGSLSDVDVAVLFDASVSSDDLFRRELALAGSLEIAVRRPIDLVVLNGAPTALAHRVVRDGVLLVSRDEERRLRFEADAISAFLDFRGVLDRYDAHLLARAREGRLGARP
jgi:predicted nucleotidyltransferase